MLLAEIGDERPIRDARLAKGRFNSVLETALFSVCEFDIPVCRHYLPLGAEYPNATVIYTTYSIYLNLSVYAPNGLHNV